MEPQTPALPASRCDSSRGGGGEDEPAVPEQTNRFPGIGLEQARGGAKRGSRSLRLYNPTLGESKRVVSPAPPRVIDSLRESRRQLSRRQDSSTFEVQHKAVLAQDPNAFFRKHGSLQDYVEHAHRNVDMLPWQSSQPRDRATTSGLNRQLTRNRPASEYYDVLDWAMSNTGRHLATSPILQHRHSQSQLRRMRSLVKGGVNTLPDSPHHFQFHPSLTLGPPSPGSAGGTQGATTRSAPARMTRSRMGRVARSGRGTPGFGPDADEVLVPSTVGLDERPEAGFNASRTQMLRFEQAQHNGVINFEDWTKAELLELIDDMGAERPGNIVWDSERGEMVQEPCKKPEYVECCRKLLTAAERQPVVRRVKKLKGTAGLFCVVSVFPGWKGGAHIQAYCQETCEEVSLILIPLRMLNLHLKPAPSSEDLAAWKEWTTRLLPRLELSKDMVLTVGPAPLKPNGLPMNFTLSDDHPASRRLSADQSLEPKKTKGPGNVRASRAHTTRYFEL